MWKFIVVTFFFLGLSFYEMSGGADFDAEELRLSRVDDVPNVLAPTASTQIAEVAPEIEEVQATVTRASFNLNSTSTVSDPKPAPVEQVAAVEEEKEQTLILPSLITNVTQVSAQDDVVDTSPVLANDIRAVSGNRVNVRSGPGASFGVVTRLTRGEEVEVLSDPGTGWVKLRPLAGGNVGWMADFLLAEI
jgi:hypothetical protein